MALNGLIAANNLSDVVDIERTWDNIGSNISATVFVPSPTLDLNFAANKSLVDDISGNNLITFSRASTGTFVGSNGLLQTAASGVPRFDHNPTTGESLGLLVEEARTNTMWPSIISAGTWSYNSVTPTYNATTAPDGTNTATLLTPNPGLAGFRARREGVSHPTGPGRITFYAKSNGLGWVGIASGLGNPFFYSNAAYNVLTGASRTYFLGSSGYIFNSAINVGNGWWRITIEYYGSLPGGDFCFVGVTTNANGDIVNSSTANGVDGMYVWGVQFELGTFPTSYIPTSSSTVTRAADVASMTGTNFSSWYNQSQGTIFASVRTVTPASVANGFLQLTDGTVNNRIELAQVNSGDAFPRVEGLYRYLNSTTANFQNQETGWIPNGATVDNWAFGFNSTGYTFQTKFDTTPSTGSGTFPQNLTNFSIGHKGTIARLTYYPVRLSNITLQALTTYGPVSSFPYSFSIKGRDILALKEVNKTSTRDFVFIKGLSSKAQPRITTASQYTASGVALRNAAMLKVAPTTVGNYFFSSGLTVSGTTVQINGTNALSIATSPFSSATATVPLLFAGLRPQANWRFSEAMTSGTVVSPEFAIPIETSDFLLFIKTGQS